MLACMLFCTVGVAGYCKCYLSGAALMSLLLQHVTIKWTASTT